MNLTKFSRGGSRGVEHLTHNPKIEGSNPGADTRRKKERGKIANRENFNIKASSQDFTRGVVYNPFKVGVSYLQKTNQILSIILMIKHPYPMY
jgi:hypothetical protein